MTSGASRTRLAGLVVAIGLALAAAWLLIGRSSGGSSTVSGGGARDEAGEGAGAGGLFGGVAAREADARGQYSVRAEVVDEDGQPLEEGSVVLTCLDPTGVHPIDGGVVRIRPQGVLEGPGCAFEVCAELRHPSRVPAEPWVLRPSEPVTLTARTLSRLEGEVVGADGQPVPAATVAFTRPPGDEVDPAAVLPLMTRSTTTDADGRFTVAWVERPPCDPCREATVGCDRTDIPFVDAFVVSVRAHGHGPAQQRLSIDDAMRYELDEPLRIELPASRDILSGRLVDPDGAAYPRAYVLARSLERPSEQRRGSVDGLNFEVDGLGSGAYRVRAIQDGVELAVAESAEPGQDVLLTGSRSATGPDVIVEVVDGRGRPSTARIDGGPFRDAQTDAQGEVRADAVLPGELRLRIRVPGRKAFMKAWTIPAGGGDPQDDGAVPPVRLKLNVEAERP